MIQPASDGRRRDDCLAGGGEMGALMRSLDWTQTSLGPVDGWSPALRSTVALLLHNHSGLLLWWGPQLVQLYNDAYRPVLGDKHPRAMAQPVSECWSEIWHIIGPMIERPFRGGPASTSDDLLLPLRRKNFLEEAHFRIAYSPVPDATAHPTGIGGVLATVTETTEQAYGERQLRTLRELGARSSAEARTQVDACAAAAATLGQNPWDVPFALLYLIDRDGGQARLVATAGFAGSPDPAIAPASVDLSATGDAGPWPIRAAANEQRAVAVEDLARTAAALPPSPWSERPRSALALPLAAPEQALGYGVMVCGISPHRELDAGYRAFLEIAAAQIATAIRNARALEDERQKSEALAQLDRAKTRFFANVSHEFRTPLTLMLGPTEDLLSGAHGALSAPQRAQLELLRRNQLRLQRLVNALLEFSRIEAGRINAAYRPTDLAALTRDLASWFRAAIERAGLRFTVDCPPLDEAIYVDHDLWEQIVLNLLSNALKFTFEGEIAISLRADLGSVSLQVRDTGVGVRPDDLPRLFERFHRVEETRARTHEGSGIGLALVRELARLHGGTVAAASEYGAGTTFVVTIPKGAAHLAPESLAPRPAPSPSGRPAAFVEEAARWLVEDEGVDVPAAPGDRRAGRVLVADDNADMREYLRRILGGRWTVDAVADGAVALQAAKQHRPDLIVADVMMPGLDGFRLLKALREDAATRTIPVIMLSARAGEEARVEGLEAGADDYLVKPFSARELLARVEAHLVAAALRHQLDAERAKLHSLFESIPAMVFALSGPDHVFTLANSAFLHAVGRRDLLGRSLRDALPVLASQGHVEIVDEVYRTGAPHFGNETELAYDRTGRIEPRIVNFVYVASRSGRGEIDGVAAFGFDVTDQVVVRRNAEEQRRIAEASRQQAEIAIRARDEFLTIASHELRTPLTTLGLQLDGLLRGLGEHPSDPHAREWIRKAERARGQAERLEEIIEGIIDVFNLSTASVDLVREDVDLAQLASRVIRRLEPESRRAHAAIELVAAPVIGHWDARRLEQILCQLLSNALKFGAGKTVKVVVDDAGDVARVTVIDRGIGIATEHHDRIFGRFERASSPNNYGGFGLGLWIVRELVTAMRGAVHVESTLGHGSSFVVELPRHP